METAALVAPVTAAEFVQDAFLLTGEGPVLTLYSLQPHPKVSASLSVLQQYRIHGIRPRFWAASLLEDSASGTREGENELSFISGASFYDLAVFGGKAVRLVRLHVNLHHRNDPHIEILGPLMELQDWALDVRWLFGEERSLVCVAVAHNSALLLDVTTGSALVQRSCLEGCLLYSALLLVNESWADTVLVGGTVFNQVVLWKPGGVDNSSTSEDKAPVERRLLGHTGVIFSIAYLQEKGWLASASDDRSVRVWDVGLLGGHGAECGHSNPVCLRVLYGHQARVFSICLSQGKVYSAGEDGACLIWDSAFGGKVVRTLKGHRAGGVRALAVSEGTGNEGRWVATGGADGGVRLWRVDGSEERNERMEEPLTEKLIDLKCPGFGLPKIVCRAGGEDENGSQSWSQSKFVVCTDQGRIYQYSNREWGVIWEGTPEFQSYCVMETVAVNAKDSAEKVHLCAVGNLSGSIQVFPISHPHCGILLTGGSGKIHTLIWHEARENLYLLASGADGLVFRWSLEVKLDGNCPLALSVFALPSFLLPPCAKRWLTAAVCLHSMSPWVLWVCGDRRGSLLLFQERGTLEQELENDKMVGTDLARGQNETDIEGAEGEGNACEPVLHPLNCLFGVHGKQGVTSVCEYDGLLYSTGRDGCVRIFKVCQVIAGDSVKNKGGLQLEVLRVQRACKGMEWLEGVLILEPEIPVHKEEEEEDGVQQVKKHRLIKEQHLEDEGEMTNKREREARFVIVGFQAVNFVVWDPVRQERLLLVPCGGGHRSWTLWPSQNRVWPGYGALVFIKHGAVLASQPPSEALNSYGKAGMTAGLGLREGVHGRGIGCVCRIGSIRGIRYEAQPVSTGELSEGKDELKDEEHWEIVVTGGEDTSLTVLAVQPNTGSIKVLSVITDHISSVRTVTMVTRLEVDGENQTLSALLVSAGGRAQMQCYRLLVSWDGHRLVPSCQVIQVAGHRLDEQWERRRNRHKTVKMDPETRYMSIVVLEENRDCHHLAVACSDGALRLFSVSEVKRQIDLLWETFYHQRCVLSVATCSLEDGTGNRCKLLFSAATDGKIAVWDFTEVRSISTISSSSPPSLTTPCLNIPAHQSGINSLAVWMDKQEGGCLVTVASGGDDGQLTVSIIRVQYPQDVKTGGSREFSQISEPLNPPQAQFQHLNGVLLHLHSQYKVPGAHAAPLTALKLLRQGTIVSTSADQRVCLWRISSTGISQTGALCSHVADAAGLAVWEGEEGGPYRKTGFESEREISVWRGRSSQRGMKTICMRPESEAGSVKDKETEPVKASGETGESKEENAETSKENNENKEKIGWVLVCGQGFQLLCVQNTETDEENGRVNERVKVALQQNST